MGARMVCVAAAGAVFDDGVAGAAARYGRVGFAGVLGRGFGEGFGHYGVDEPARW